MRTTTVILGLFIFSHIAAQLDIEWIARFNGMGDFNDRAEDIKVDHDGNVYITGSTYADNQYNFLTMKYGASGEEIWIRTNKLGKRGRSVEVDANGNVYATGETSLKNILTVKYDSSGKLLWNHIYSDSLSRYHSHINMKLTGSNNLIISADKTYWSSDDAMLFLKYDQDGNFLWDAVYGKNDQSQDHIDDFVFDENENIYCTGLTNYFYNPIIQGYDNGDILILKLDAFGNIKWLNNFYSPEKHYEWGRSICIDKDQNIFVTGFQSDSLSSRVVTMSYDSTGKQKWIQYYTEPESKRDYGDYISCGENQNLYVIGSSTYLPDKSNLLIMMYDKSGNLIWSRNYFAPAFETATHSSGILADSQGNVYGCGFTHDVGGRHDVNIIAYDEDGNSLFAKTYNVLGTSSNKVIDMVMDDNGSLYMVVECNSDIFTVKFSNHTRIFTNEMRSQNSVRIVPNPLSSISTIYLENPENKEYHIDFFDLSGKLYLRITTNEKSAKIYRKDFKSGLYIYKLKDRRALGGEGKLIVK